MDYDKLVQENLDLIESAVNQGLFSNDPTALKELLASSWADTTLLEKDNEELLTRLKEHRLAVRMYSSECDTDARTGEKFNNTTMRKNFIRLLADNGNLAAQAIEKGLRLDRVAKGKQLADAKHNRPGGSREKQQLIRKIWASGKYTSRDRCAEEECADLKMSFSAARRALRNTPDPTPST